MNNNLAKLIRPYIDNDEFNYVALFIFIWLLTYDYIWSTIIFSLFIIVLLVYVYSNASPSGNLFVRVCEKYLFCFIVGFLVVYLTIPCIKILVTLSEPVAYFIITFVLVHQITQFVFEYFNISKEAN